MVERHRVTEIVGWTSTICFFIRTTRKRFANICAAILTFDLCLMHLVNVVLPELMSDENFITKTGQFALCRVIKPFWFSSEVLNWNLFCNCELSFFTTFIHYSAYRKPFHRGQGALNLTSFLIDD